MRFSGHSRPLILKTKSMAVVNQAERPALGHLAASGTGRLLLFAPPRP